MSQRRLRASPVTFEDQTGRELAFVVCEYEVLCVVDAKGLTVWKQKLASELTSTPFLTSDAVYLTESVPGELKKFELRESR